MNSGSRLLIRVLCVLLCFTVPTVKALSQQDSCGLNISVLTCAPGPDLYSVFGHSAIRVQDARNGMDITFNYGTFDYDDPSFYLKFMRGEMRYYLSYTSTADFLPEYRLTGRAVIEQRLQLTCADKEKLFQALRENAAEENRYYSYSFLYDNCSTRIRDILAKQSRSLVRFNNILPARVPTFRNMIHEYLHRGEQHWSQLGIDLLLGANIDKKVTNTQAMFLPDYLMKGFDSAQILLKPDPSSLQSIVQSKSHLYAVPLVDLEMSWFNPYLVITALSMLLLVASFGKKGTTRTAVYIDRVLFFVTGMLGLLMLGLWLGRQDTVCQNNMNLIWALPLHTIAAFYIGRQQRWLRIYFLISGTLGALLLLGWPWWPQQLNNSLVPLVMLLTIRSFVRSKT
ncbi:MAG: DUF4105 domain-containing protein [Sphingobacteriales bacterium]|nr:MAG: DUF4105 domain-containing protein [Sphingobacteriales bacterium]